MRLTKEKVLAAICALIAAFVLATAQSPAVVGVPELPPEEGPRAYRTLSATPRLAPEGARPAGARDPFRVHDPWAQAAPATLALPPVERWPRALPGGLESVPRAPHDRVLVTADPAPKEAPR